MTSIKVGSSTTLASAGAVVSTGSGVETVVSIVSGGCSGIGELVSMGITVASAGSGVAVASGISVEGRGVLVSTGTSVAEGEAVDVVRDGSEIGVSEGMTSVGVVSVGTGVEVASGVAVGSGVASPSAYANTGLII